MNSILKYGLRNSAMFNCQRSFAATTKVENVLAKDDVHSLTFIH
jgi:hypothetical protein